MDKANDHFDRKAQALIDAAARAWASEEENAARLADRARIQMSIIMGFAGVLLYKSFGVGALWALYEQDGIAVAAISALMVIAIAFLHFAFGQLMLPTANPSDLGFASSELLLDEDLWSDTVSFHDASLAVYIRTVYATLNLHERNVKRKKQIARSMEGLSASILLVIVAIIVYHVAGGS